MKRLLVILVTLGVLGTVSAASAHVTFSWGASAGFGLERHTPTSSAYFSFALDGFPVSARRALTERLLVVPGVRIVEYRPVTQEVVVIYEPRRISRERILTVVETSPWCEAPRRIVVERPSARHRVERIVVVRDDDGRPRGRARGHDIQKMRKLSRRFRD